MYNDKENADISSNEQDDLFLSCKYDLNCGSSVIPEEAKYFSLMSICELCVACSSDFHASLLSRFTSSCGNTLILLYIYIFTLYIYILLLYYFYIFYFYISFNVFINLKITIAYGNINKEKT